VEVNANCVGVTGKSEKQSQDK